MKRVVFACVHNAGRSQMAAALFNQIRAGHQWEALSAGTEPADHVHLEVLEVMREVGVDLSGATPQRLTEELCRGASLLITMGCGENCPYVPGLETRDWPLPDPKGQGPEQVREIRDEVRRRVEALYSELSAHERGH